MDNLIDQTLQFEILGISTVYWGPLAFGLLLSLWCFFRIEVIGSRQMSTGFLRFFWFSLAATFAYAGYLIYRFLELPLEPPYLVAAILVLLAVAFLYKCLFQPRGALG